MKRVIVKQWTALHSKMSGHGVKHERRLSGSLGEASWGNCCRFPPTFPHKTYKNGTVIWLPKLLGHIQVARQFRLRVIPQSFSRIGFVVVLLAAFGCQNDQSARNESWANQFTQNTMGWLMVTAQSAHIQKLTEHRVTGSGHVDYLLWDTFLREFYPTGSVSRFMRW